jgi:ribosomal protein S18 acetylase RimI-like enzyme
VHPLDNAVWHALHGPHVTLAEQRPFAARYFTDVTPFGAVTDEPDETASDDLRALVGPGHGAVLFRAGLDVPETWEVLFRGDGVQMVLDGPIRSTPLRATSPAAAVTVATLAHADIPAMLDLVARTQPGPFLPRTIELGTYLGITVDGVLVSMAGERMHLDGYTEVSAVCTDTVFRGRGFAETLVRAIVDGVHARGEVAFLHAAATNERAIKLYDAMGFSTRRIIEVIAARAPR